MNAATGAEERADAILTVRLKSGVKENATKILQSKGLTPSAAVQHYFNVIVQTGEVPFQKEPKRPSCDEIERRLDALSRFQTKVPVHVTDDEIRAARIKERYGLDLG